MTGIRQQTKFSDLSQVIRFSNRRVTHKLLTSQSTKKRKTGYDTENPTSQELRTVQVRQVNGGDHWRKHKPHTEQHFLQHISPKKHKPLHNEPHKHTDYVPHHTDAITDPHPPSLSSAVPERHQSTSTSTHRLPIAVIPLGIWKISIKSCSHIRSSKHG